MDADQRGRLRDGFGSAADFDSAGLPWVQHVVDDHGGAAAAGDVAVLLGGLQAPAADVNAVVVAVVAPADGCDVWGAVGSDGGKPGQSRLGQQVAQFFL